MPSWKKVIVSGSDAVLNTLTVTNGITGSLHGTASWARNATTASYVLNAVSSSFASTASYINPLNQLVIITGSLIQGLEGNIATGEYSHAEGSITQATGDYSHAEGDYTQAKGNYSHAEGQETIASGSYSHAEGYQTIALANHQHVQGQFNTVSSVPAAFIVGNGTDNNNRSNLIYAHDSTVEITGSLIVPSITGSLFGTASWARNSITSSFVTGSNVYGPFGSNSVISASFATFAQTASFASNGGVTQILAGPNITVSPISGKGQVTISSTGTGSGNFNTSTGSYGSFYDTTTQLNPVANAANSMSFNETAITNGVSLSGSTNPFNTYIKTETAGVYNIQFSAQIDKTDGGEDNIDIWIRKNGTDLIDTATSLTLPKNNNRLVAAWNWFVQSAANDYYQIIWSSADIDMRLLAEASSSLHPGIPSVILTANRIDQFLSNTGSFNGTFNGQFTGSLQGTASFANNATSASFATTSSYVLNALSASFATSASIAQTAATASFVTASNVFGPFGSNSIISSSYALTASFALNGGGGGGSNPAVTHTQLTASTTWSFNHNLNTQTPLLQVYDLGYEQIIPNEIVSIDAFTSEIRFDYTQAGYAVASSGGGLIVTGSTARLTQIVAATTWSFQHNLGTKYPGFEIFNSNDDVIIPAGIHAVDINNAEIYFAIPSTGIAIANFSGISGSFENTISASYAATASYSDAFSIGQTLTRYATVTSSINGSNTVFTQATGSYSSAFFKYTVASGSNARSGEIMSVWNGTTSAFTDNSTTDIGTTTVVTSSIAISGANVQLNMQTNTAGWRIKSISTFM